MIVDLFLKTAAGESRETFTGILRNALNRIYSYKDGSMKDALNYLVPLHDLLVEQQEGVFPDYAVHALLQQINTERQGEAPGLIEAGKDYEGYAGEGAHWVNEGSMVPTALTNFLRSFYTIAPMGEAEAIMPGMQLPIAEVSAALRELIEAVQTDAANDQHPPPPVMNAILDYAPMIMTSQDPDTVHALAWMDEQDNAHMSVQTELSPRYELVITNMDTGEEYMREEVDAEYAEFGEIYQALEDLGQWGPEEIAETLGIDEDLVDGRFDYIEGGDRWRARLQASGYMDVTDWTYAPDENNTEIGAILEIYNLYGHMG